jgi:hypothetical protein
MRPFSIGKATHRQEAGRLRRFEKEGTALIAKELDKLRKRLMRGINADNVQQLNQRMNDPEYIGPFHDALDRLMQEWAAAGVDIGRRQIEKEIYGVRR